MAENKKCVLLYTDLIYTVEKLDDSDAGKLFKHFLRYVNDQDPEPESKLIEIVFEPWKQSLKRDLKKWEEKQTERSRSGRIGNLKRWNVEMYNRVRKEEITLEEAEEMIANNRSESLSDENDRKVSQEIANIAVNGTVTVTGTDIDKEKNKKKKVGTASRFQEPNEEDVYKCFLEKTNNNVIAARESQKFMSHYGSNGWKVGKNKMKSWPHAVSGWISRMQERELPKKKQGNALDNFRDSIRLT